MATRPSARLTNDIINEIYRTGGYAWRAGSTGIPDRARGVMRTAPKKGVSDVVGIYKGIFFAIEVKIGTDELSPEQKGFLKNIEYHGGCSFVAKNFDDFQQWWRNQQAWIQMVSFPRG